MAFLGVADPRVHYEMWATDIGPRASSSNGKPRGSSFSAHWMKSPGPVDFLEIRFLARCHAQTVNLVAVVSNVQIYTITPAPYFSSSLFRLPTLTKRSGMYCYWRSTILLVVVWYVL